MKLLHQGSLPIVPRFIISAVRIDVGKEVQSLHPGRVFYGRREIGHGIRIADIFRRGGSPEGQVMIDKEHDHLETMARVAKPFTDFCGKNGACVFMMPNLFGSSGIVHEKRDIHGDGILHFLEDLPEKLLLWILRVNQAVKNVNAS